MGTDAGGWIAAECPISSVRVESRPMLKVMPREEAAESCRITALRVVFNHNTFLHDLMEGSVMMKRI